MNNNMFQQAVHLKLLAVYKKSCIFKIYFQVAM